MVSWLVAALNSPSADKHGLTPLTLAAWKGHVDVVDMLLRSGADANRQDLFGLAPKHKVSYMLPVEMYHLKLET